MKGVFGCQWCYHSVAFWSIHSLYFVCNECNCCLKDWEVKSLEAKLCGLSPAHSIPPRVSAGHSAAAAVQRPLVWVAVGLPRKRLDQQQGACNCKNITSISTLLGVLWLASKGTKWETKKTHVWASHAFLRETNKAPSKPQIWTAVFPVSTWSTCRPHGLGVQWAELLRGQQPCSFCGCKSESLKIFFGQAENQTRLLEWWSLPADHSGGLKPFSSPPLSPAASRLWFWVVKPYCWGLSVTEQMFKEMLWYFVSEEENIEWFLFSECVFSVAA